MQKRRADAAIPRTASARRSQTGLLLSSSHLLQLGVEFVEHGARIEAGMLLLRLLDPVLDDRPRALLRLGLHLGRRGRDIGAGRLERIKADLVGAIPRLAVR